MIVCHLQEPITSENIENIMTLGNKWWAERRSFPLSIVLLNLDSMSRACLGKSSVFWLP
jgi:hypothetical protein